MDTAPEQNPQPAPVTVEQTMVAPEKPATSYGAILGIIVIVAVLIAGAFYVWNDHITTDMPTEETQEEGPSVNVEVNTPQPQ